MHKPQKELKNYEYRIEITPKYCADVEEQWELVDVFIKYLPNGYPTNVVVFRKKINHPGQ